MLLFLCFPYILLLHKGPTKSRTEPNQTELLNLVQWVQTSIQRPHLVWNIRKCCFLNTTIKKMKSSGSPLDLMSDQNWCEFIVSLLFFI